MDEYLEHHGTKGMRWGIRRYQNKDGSLTELGKRRLGYGDGDRSSEQQLGDVHGLVAEEYRKVSNAQKSGGEAAYKLSSIASRSAQQKRQTVMDKMDLSKMTDSELQKAINRMNLEKNYRSLSTENIQSGRRRLSSYLQTFGDVLTVGSSAAAIAVAIHELKK